MWCYCYIFYLITEFFVLESSGLFTDHWFVSINSLNDLIQDFKTFRGQKVYLSVDLTFGTLASRSLNVNPSPIIAGTEPQFSDLTLEAFLETIIATKSLRKAVIKFNFEEEQVLQPALQILKSKMHLLPFEIWLQANVLVGSREKLNKTNSQNIINPKKFFNLVDQFKNDVPISLGWKSVATKYEWEDVQDMANLIRCLNIYHPVNFGFKVSLAWKSVPMIQWLLQVIPKSSAEFFQESETDDIIYFENLVGLNMVLGMYPLYFSLFPGSDEVENFRQIFNTKQISQNYTQNDFSYSREDWIVRPDRLQSSPASCILSPYITSDSLLINGGETTFLIMNQRFHVPTSFSAKMTIIDSLSEDKLSYYISTFSVLAVKSQKMPSSLEDITTEKMWSALRHRYTKKLDHHSDGNDVTELNSTYYFRLSVGDDKCSYISKTKMDVTRNNTKCKNNQVLTGDYVIFVIMHDGWSSVILEDIHFTGLTLNQSNESTSSIWFVSFIVVIAYLCL